MTRASFLIGCLLLVPRPAPGCSRVEYPLSRHPGNVFFLATALDDTVLARAGDVRYALGGGHSGYGRRRPIYGQLARLERVGQPWTKTLPAGTDEVVLVPWDYGPDCSTTIWGPSFRWVAPGTRGLFFATLRDTAHWVQGRPTFDVSHPDFVPYPSAPRLKYRRDTTEVALSPDQALAFFERLPEHSALVAGSVDALQPLEAWTREHPDLARRDPARRVLRYVRHTFAGIRLRSTPSPFAGTYRFVITLAAGDSTVVYARTERQPDHFLISAREDLGDRDMDAPPSGYYLIADWRRSERALPKRYSGQHNFGFAVALQPLLDAPDSTVWRGNAGALSAASEIFKDDWDRDRRRVVWLARPQDPEWHYLPGYWIQYRDGRLRFEQSAGEKPNVVTVRGERISTDTLIARSEP